MVNGHANSCSAALAKDFSIIHAGVMELVDVMDSKSIGSDTVPVRVRPPAPYYDVTLKRVRREKSLRFFGGFSLFVHQFLL